jgi:hypothetical protein
MTDFSELDNIEEIRELLASFVLGDLTSEEVAQVNQLLESYPHLKEEVDSLQKTLALFPLALPEVELPSHLKEQILQSPSGKPNRIKSTILKFKPYKTKLLSVKISIIASVILVIGGYNFYLKSQIIALKTELNYYQYVIARLNEPNNNLVSLKGTQLNPQAQGSLLVMPQSDLILVSLENVTPLPQDKIYRLWGVVEGKKVFCAEFQPDSQGKILLKLPLDVDMLESSGVVITIEPSEKLTYPTGETVIIGS